MGFFSKLLFSLVIIVSAFVVQLLYDANELTPAPLLNHSPNQCTRIQDETNSTVGVEDGDWLDFTHQIWSADNRIFYYGPDQAHLPYRSRLAAMPTLGSLLMVTDDPSSSSPSSVKVDKCTLKDFGQRFFHPHGVAVLRLAVEQSAGQGDLPFPTTPEPNPMPNPDDSDATEYFIFVVNHTPQGDSIELFRHLSFDPYCELQFIESIRNGTHFHELNDIAPVSIDEFYVSNDNYYEMGTMMRYVETFGRFKWGRITHCKRKRDGNGENTSPWKCRWADNGLQYPNGVVLSADQRYLLVAEVVSKQIRVYERNPKNGKLFRTGIIPTPFFGPDNIVLDRSTGEFLVAGHPKLLTFLKHQKSANLSVPAPSMVVRIKINEWPQSIKQNPNSVEAQMEGETGSERRSKPGQARIAEFENRIIPHEIRLVHGNEGDLFPTSTTALLSPMKIFVGAVFVKDMMVCELTDPQPIISSYPPQQSQTQAQ